MLINYSLIEREKSNSGYNNHKLKADRQDLLTSVMNNHRKAQDILWYEAKKLVIALYAIDSWTEIKCNKFHANDVQRI